jgi:putative SOS response-associated peptidase YedK
LREGFSDGYGSEDLAIGLVVNQISGMCGRGAQYSDPALFAAAFGVTGPLPNLRQRWNAAPLQELGVVRRNPETGARSLGALKWGLVPSWSNDEKPGFATINARAETVATSPTYRAAWKAGRRCLVPFDLFFEWQERGDTKQPYAIARADRTIMGLAGLWESKRLASDGVLRTFTIITCPPNALMAALHDRMPVIIGPANYARWLGDEPAEPDEMIELLRPYPAELMTAWPVGAAVGNWRNDTAETIEPVEVGAA